MVNFHAQHTRFDLCMPTPNVQSLGNIVAYFVRVLTTAPVIYVVIIRLVLRRRWPQSNHCPPYQSRKSIHCVMDAVAISVIRTEVIRYQICRHPGRTETGSHSPSTCRPGVT